MCASSVTPWTRSKAKLAFASSRESPPQTSSTFFPDDTASRISGEPAERKNYRWTGKSACERESSSMSCFTLWDSFTCTIDRTATSMWRFCGRTSIRASSKSLIVWTRTCSTTTERLTTINPSCTTARSPSRRTADKQSFRKMRISLARLDTKLSWAKATFEELTQSITATWRESND